jgi:DNA polymerase-3 subunit gamma/tau
VTVADEQQHQALYRRYRPQSPQEVLGQDHVVRALTGSIAEGRLAHAFLFCGPRGTGKTSTARILAKMVNCENGPTAEPCGTCEQCVAIRDGHHLDVFEIDAASHGGVEDARELREKAPTAPAYGREKVYIIDEAQRLSREAFDALLKVFEEPPTGVRFVLATTEPHKMPATIVGRCQRFDFRRLTMDTLSDLLQRLAKEEEVTLSPSAAATIARQAEGSARDSLSLLDQAMVVAGGVEIDDQVVAALLGAPRAEIQRRLADAVAVGDAKEVFEVVHRLVQEGQDLRHVTSEALSHFRNLLLARSAPGQEDLLDVTPEEYEQLRQQAAKFSPSELSRVIGLLLDAQADMRWTTSPRISFELAMIRATIPETDPEPEGLVSRLERLERLAGVESGTVQVVATGEESAAPAQALREREDVPAPAEALPTEAPPAPAEEPTTEAPPAEEPPEAVPPPAEAPAQQPATSNLDVEMFRRSWPNFIEHLHAQRQPILKALLESATPVAYDGTTLELAFPPDRSFGVQKVSEKMEHLRGALQDVFGVAPQVLCVARDPVVQLPDPEIDDEPAPTEEEALRRLKEQLGAEVAPQPEAE